MRATNTPNPLDLAQILTLLIALVVVRFYYHALFFVVSRQLCGLKSASRFGVDFKNQQFSRLSTPLFFNQPLNRKRKTNFGFGFQFAD